MTEYRVVWKRAGQNENRAFLPDISSAQRFLQNRTAVDKDFEYARIESREVSDWTTVEASDGK